MYIELQVTSNYSFLRGASHVEELIAQAADLKMPALGITDHSTVAGVVRAHQRAQEAGIRLIVGCRLNLTNGPSILVYPIDRPAWSRLTRLLTLGKRRTERGQCELFWDDLQDIAEGTIAVLCSDLTEPNMYRLRASFLDRAYVALTATHHPDEVARLLRVTEAARASQLPTVATNDVLYHAPERHTLQDILTCIREKCTIDQLGKNHDTSTRYLKASEEMGYLFACHPEAIARTQEIAERCRFTLDELRYQYPRETYIPGLNAQQTLEKLTWDAALHRYSNGIPNHIAQQLRHELELIGKLEYAPYFLTVSNIAQYARLHGILCQGRGSAANSIVCYVLGITAIDPTRNGLLFERFVSNERKEPPDIDIDFEHDRREEMVQWIYTTYGPDRAGLCATVIRYRGRSAIRDVGKALGLSEDTIKLLVSQVWSWSSEEITKEQAASLSIKLGDRLLLARDLARELIGFPRHMSQHPGGFVLTEDRLDDLVPIQPASMAGRQVIEWDKDDIDALRFMKVDVLGLGMLSCMRRAFNLLASHRALKLDLATIPEGDPATYTMIQEADTLGTFQIESRAQMSMLPRLKPSTFYDLVIQIAIVRPGPIQGNMVHPYLHRRENMERIEYPTPELRGVLGKTLGVPLFQEQAMQIAITCAGFTPSEADALRRSMATFKLIGGVSHFKQKLIAGMMANGYSKEFAECTFSQIKGFGSYGFPESHAASFALIAYASAWVKCHHPDIFCCALLNTQPMGFYAVSQIVQDARSHGVEVRPVSVNHSEWDCTLESTDSQFAVRLGMRIVKGISRDQASEIVAHRGTGYQSMQEISHRADIPLTTLARLAEADAFESLGMSRRDALWAVRGFSDLRLPLSIYEDSEPTVTLAQMNPGQQVIEDYRSTSLSLRQHPVSFLRSALTRQGIARCADLAMAWHGETLEVAGIVLVRQRPGSATGVVFATIEDETGYANLIIWPPVFESQRQLILSAKMIACRGKLQREHGVIHVAAKHLTDLSGWLRRIGLEDSKLLLSPCARIEEGNTSPANIIPRLDAYMHDLQPREINLPTRDFR